MPRCISAVSCLFSPVTRQHMAGAGSALLLPEPPVPRPRRRCEGEEPAASASGALCLGVIFNLMTRRKHRIVFGEQVWESGEVRRGAGGAGGSATQPGSVPSRGRALGAMLQQGSRRRLLCLGAVLSRPPLHVKQVGFAATGPSLLPPGGGFTRCRCSAVPLLPGESSERVHPPGRVLPFFLPSGLSFCDV